MWCLQLLLASTAVAAPSPQPPPPLLVAIDRATAAFNVSLAGRLWLRGGCPTAGWPGGGALALLNHSTATGVHPTLGAYNEDRFHWSAAARTPVETAFRLFDDGETALLLQTFPAGLPHQNSAGSAAALLGPSV